MRASVCSECDRLWKEYGDAIFAQIRARNQLAIAGFSYDHANPSTISVDVELWTSVRSGLQLLIRNHNLQAHSRDITCSIALSKGMAGTTGWPIPEEPNVEP
jgi:hypothetical protein